MRSGYMNLAKMVAIHFVIMFALTYSMVNSVDNIHLNINRMYMAAMMVSPMVVLMLILMPSMFPNQKLNYLLMAIFTAALVVFFPVCSNTGFCPGSAVLALDDSSSFERYPDVRESFDHGSRDSVAMWRDRGKSEA